MTSDIELSPLVLTVPLSLDPVLRSSTILFMVFETWPHLSRPCSKCVDPRAGLQLGWDPPGVETPLHSFQIRCFLSPVSSGRRRPLLWLLGLLRFRRFPPRWSQLFQPCPSHSWSAGSLFPPGQGEVRLAQNSSSSPAGSD